MADDLYSILQQVDPATLQKMVESGLFDERSIPLKEKFGIGNEMLNTPMAQGRNVGNTYVASSPLEHLSNAIRQIVGARQTQSAMQGQGALADRVGQGNLAYMNLIAKASRLRQVPPQPDMMPPTDNTD